MEIQNALITLIVKADNKIDSIFSCVFLYQIIILQSKVENGKRNILSSAKKSLN